MGGSIESQTEVHRTLPCFLVAVDLRERAQERGHDRVLERVPEAAQRNQKNQVPALALQREIFQQHQTMETKTSEPDQRMG